MKVMSKKKKKIYNIYIYIYIYIYIELDFKSVTAIRFESESIVLLNSD